jgi:hypothetical protein
MLKGITIVLLVAMVVPILIAVRRDWKMWGGWRPIHFILMAAAVALGAVAIVIATYL